jgi:hypothetical protein
LHESRWRMTAVRGASTEFTMTLTEEERAQLLNWLERKQRDKLVEEHRTKTPDYRDYVLHEEAILEKLIDKLRSS